jgi:DNA processing protein
MNMSYQIRDAMPEDFPPLLREITDPPKSLRVSGTLPPTQNKILCVVGSRKHTEYGREVCEELVASLRGLPVTIVSGLALGIDSIAHKTALKNNIHTVAIPGSGLDPNVLYPRSHLRLAEEIVESGGALLSEFADDFKPTLWSFPQRNRIMAGISHAVLVIEAEEKSGTLITSKLATEYNRDVFAVPGSIFSKQSAGPHMLIRLGATPITKPEDLVVALGFSIEEKEKTSYVPETDEEKMIIEFLAVPHERDDIIRQCGLPAHVVNGTLAVLEIKGVITESMGEIRLT